MQFKVELSKEEVDQAITASVLRELSGMCVEDVELETFADGAAEMTFKAEKIDSGTGNVCDEGGFAELCEEDWEGESDDEEN
jgi:hypothetical protein